MFGTDFEEELGEEFGIKRVPGSGNQWHSKLDLKGFAARWSLKSTKNKSISITQDTIDEAIRECYSNSGDSSIPLWAFRIGDREHDMIMLRKDDFVLLQRGELKVIQENVKDHIAQKRKRANTPTLLRDDQ
jgi:hypothetical protein